MTGLGYVHGFTLFAGEDSADTYQGATDDEPLEKHVLLHSSREYWAFPFHDFCWQLLLLRLGCDARPEEVAVLLFGVLNGLPRVKSGASIPEHRYHGAIDLRWDRNGRGLLSADPKQDLPVGTGPGVPLAQNDQVHALERPFDEVFVHLPTEILHKILCHLPSRDVCNLRLSSRSIAAVSSEHGLPPSFWASRFAPDADMGFALAHVPVGGAREWKMLSWRQLYLDCRRVLQTRSGFEGLQNRKRIWRCIVDIASTLQPILQSSTTAVDGDSRPRYILAREGGRLGPQAACPRLDDRLAAQNGPQFGARFSWTKEFYFCRSQYRGAMLCKASLVPYNSRTFISGLEIHHEDEDPNLHMLEESVGYIHRTADVSFSLMYTDSIAKIDVIMSALGIHGLRFHVRRGDGHSIETVGKTDLDHSSAGIISLLAQDRIVGLLLEFDVRQGKKKSILLVPFGSFSPFR